MATLENMKKKKTDTILRFHVLIVTTVSHSLECTILGQGGQVV